MIEAGTHSKFILNYAVSYVSTTRKIIKIEKNYEKKIHMIDDYIIDLHGYCRRSIHDINVQCAILRQLKIN